MIKFLNIRKLKIIYKIKKLKIIKFGTWVKGAGLWGNYDHLFGVKLQNLFLAEYLWKERP